MAYLGAFPPAQLHGEFANLLAPILCRRRFCGGPSFWGGVSSTGEETDPCRSPSSLRFSPRPLMPPVGEESLRGVSGQSVHAQPSLLPSPHSQARGAGSGPRARTGSPKVKRSEQGVTQNEEMRQVGARPPKVWSRHPRATRESGHPGVGDCITHPRPGAPAAALGEGPWTLPWAGRVVGGDVAPRLGSRRGWGLLPLAEDLPVHPAEAGFSFRLRTSFARSPGPREVSSGSTRGKCGGSPGPVRSFLEPCLPFPPPKLGLEVLLFQVGRKRGQSWNSWRVEARVASCRRP